MIRQLSTMYIYVQKEDAEQCVKYANIGVLKRKGVLCNIYISL